MEIAFHFGDKLITHLTGYMFVLLLPYHSLIVQVLACISDTFASATPFSFLLGASEMISLLKHPVNSFR